MNAGLLMFLAGIIIATVTEPWSRTVKLIIWVVLVILGIIYGALQAFHPFSVV